MAEVLYYAIPAFVLLLVLELLSFRYARDDELVGYEARDTRTSLAMGGGNVLIPDPGGPGRRAALERAVGDATVALGPGGEPAQLRESWELAGTMLRAMEDGALATAGLAHVDERLGDLLLFEGRNLVKRLAARRLAPLDALTPKARARMEESALAYVRHRGNAVAMASELHLHPQTVRYRLRRLRELLGEALDDPDARFELEAALRYEGRRRRGRVRKTASQRGEETPKP